MKSTHRIFAGKLSKLLYRAVKLPATYTDLLDVQNETVMCINFGLGQVIKSLEFFLLLFLCGE